MMHDREKSDAAAKPTNGGGQPSPEPVEPRGGRGNVRQAALGTPSRVGVNAGRPQKKERLTALLHHVSIALRRQAYFWAEPGCGGRGGRYQMG